MSKHGDYLIQAQKVLDFFLNLIIYTMYDYEKEEIAKEGGDIDDLISIIIIDLHDIHPSLPTQFEEFLIQQA